MDRVADSDSDDDDVDDDDDDDVDDDDDDDDNDGGRQEGERRWPIHQSSVVNCRRLLARPCSSSRVALCG